MILFNFSQHTLYISIIYVINNVLLLGIILGKWTTQKHTKIVKKKKMKEQLKSLLKKPQKKNGTFRPKKKRYKENKTIKSRKSELKSLIKNSIKRSLRSTRRNNRVRNLIIDNKKTKTRTPPRKRKFSLHSSKVKKKSEEIVDVVMQDHDYINTDEKSSDCCSNSDTSPCYGFSSSDTSQIRYKAVDQLCSELNQYIEAIQTTPNHISPQYITLDPEIKPKSLHRTLVHQKTRKRRFCNNTTDCEAEDSPNWDTDESPSTSKHNRNDKRNNLSHSIRISKDAGAVIKAFYSNFNLIIAQEYEVTFWNQSALGNVLGAHNMWLPKGQINRLVLDNGCMQKDSNEMVISLESSIAYVELWTKEHKSDKREIPVADVFAALYFCKLRQNGVFKKVLQLENIKR